MVRFSTQEETSPLHSVRAQSVRVGNITNAQSDYFFRAYALEPDNPMINLSIALSYVQHAVKRQADNRHHHVMQGFAFLSRYYDIRSASGDACGQQEAEYNIARAYHLLGLTHSAITYYKRCLDLSDAAQGDQMQKVTDDFSREAALALQGLWATAGDHEKARRLTRAWLII
jgi:general transcription factor 3C polypeptide 3 (transcription factor C subunit 4)